MNGLDLLVFGLVGPIGCDKTLIYNFFKDKAEAYQYDYNEEIIIKTFLEKIINQKKMEKKTAKYYEDLMHVANEFRTATNNKIMSNLATITILTNILKKHNNDKHNKRTQLYVISSLKYQEDIEEFKRIFGLNFFLIGCGSSKKPELEIDPENNNDLNQLFQKDKITKIFEKCDIFLDLDDSLVQNELTRFLDLIFSNPFSTPTKDEYFMSLAYNVASRSSSLNRQVGAILVSDKSEILSVGCNEVPKKGGGQYWDSDINDSREFKIMKRENKTSDSNRIEIEKIKNNLKNKICEGIHDSHFENLQGSIEKSIDESGFSNLIEFYREEHAEEEAIIACARNGIKSRKSILYCTAFPCHCNYCTAFPCHLCAKKIVAAGIEKVIYIEPYPKSKIHLFKDSVKINDQLTGSLTGSHENQSNDGDKVVFEKFKGIGPTRYFDFFSLNLSNGIRLKRDAENLNDPPRKPRMHKNNFLNLIFKFFERNKEVLVDISKFTDQNEKKEILEIINQLNNDIRKLNEIYEKALSTL